MAYVEKKEHIEKTLNYLKHILNNILPERGESGFMLRATFNIINKKLGHIVEAVDERLTYTREDGRKGIKDSVVPREFHRTSRKKHVRRTKTRNGRIKIKNASWFDEVSCKASRKERVK